MINEKETKKKDKVFNLIIIFVSIKHFIIRNSFYGKPPPHDMKININFCFIYIGVMVNKLD